MTIRSHAGSVTSGTPAPGPSRGISQSPPDACPFAVHLGLLAAFAASMVTVTVITEGWPTWSPGWRSWRSPERMSRSAGRPSRGCSRTSVRARAWTRPSGRLAWSDVLLALLTLNVLASGTDDLLSGNQVILHPRAVGIPFRDMGWHVLSALCCSCTSACTWRAAGVTSAVPPSADSSRPVRRSGLRLGRHPEALGVEGQGPAPLTLVEAELAQVVGDRAVAASGVGRHERGHGRRARSSRGWPARS